MKKRLIAGLLLAGMVPTLYGCSNNNNSNNVNVNPLDIALNDFSMSDVELLDAYEQNAFSLEVEYLKRLDADKLLKGFCDIAGVESDATKYGGWETSSIQGHTLGHYLTAVSQAYAVCGDVQLKAIADHIVDVLSLCQNSETGYLSAIPESHYIQIESGNTSGTWVPWYTMHKVLSGLIDAYELTGNAKALDVASNLGDWVYSRTSAWSPEMQITVLNVEYGGMNDCLYHLYSLTKSDKHLSAAHSFDEMALFDALYKGEDILNGKHANTTIPKINGALKRYMVLGEGEEYYLQVAANFWQIVINNHTYITGGNSEWEHFGEPHILDAERTNCNCETCNTYNMLKLTRELFKITGDTKYAEYYENTYINAILSSQNPQTGMTTYFQPMATGFFKVYSSETDHFWCCTGSGMENFSKLNDSIYFKDADSIYISRYTSSKVNWAEKGISITQTAELPNVKLVISGNANAKIMLRVPDWCVDEPIVSVNGEKVKAKANDSFICLDGNWSDGDVIELTLPIGVLVYGLPDNENVVAFKYGPWVLSANLGNKDMLTTTTGVDVTIPLLDASISDILVIQDGSVDKWFDNIENNLVKDENSLNFTLKGTNQQLTFSPHYMQHQNRYGIYFRLADSDTKIAENDADKYIVVDSLPVGNDQYEFSHNLKADLSNSGNFKGFMFRDAVPNGYFSYDMAVDNTATNYLAVKYYSGDVGRAFDIYIDDVLFEQVTLQDPEPNGFYDVYYPITANMVENKQTITVTFKSTDNSYAGGIFDKISIVKDK